MSSMLTDVVVMIVCLIGLILCIAIVKGGYRKIKEQEQADE